MDDELKLGFFFRTNQVGGTVVGGGGCGREAVVEGRGEDAQEGADGCIVKCVPHWTKSL